MTNDTLPAGAELMPKGSISELEIVRVVALAAAPMTAREIADTVGLPRATVYRLLATLECSGWLEGKAAPKRFAPSLRSGEISRSQPPKQQSREELRARRAHVA